MVLAYLAPVWMGLTALAAWPIMGEPLGIPQVAGGRLILAGVYIVHKSRPGA